MWLVRFPAQASASSQNKFGTNNKQAGQHSTPADVAIPSTHYL